MTHVPIKLIQRILEEFEEAPQLRVTVGEAARFWGLDEATSEQVLAQLLATGFLARGIDQRFAPTGRAAGPVVDIPFIRAHHPGHTSRRRVAERWPSAD